VRVYPSTAAAAMSSMTIGNSSKSRRARDEAAEEREERERDEALASRDREICALRKHLDERNRLGKAARGNLVAILDDTQGTNPSSPSCTRAFLLLKVHSRTDLF